MKSKVDRTDNIHQESETVEANPFTYLDDDKKSNLDETCVKSHSDSDLEEICAKSDSHSELEETCVKSNNNDEFDVKKLKRDIRGLRKKLKIFGISFRDLLACAPKNHDSIYMCIKAAKAIVQNEWIMEKIRKKKTLPIQDVLCEVNVYHATLKKNSKYIITLCLIITGDLETLCTYIDNTYAKKEQVINSGSILELAQDGAVVMTSDCRFLLIQKKKRMHLGQQVNFADWDIKKYKPNIVKKVAAVIVLMGSAALLPLFFSLVQTAPVDNVYALVAIDINPSLGLSVDRNNSVVGVNAINRDADILLMDNDLRGMPVEDAIEMVFEFAHDRGFVYEDKENLVLVSIALNPDAEKKGDEAKMFEYLFNSIKSEVKGDEVIIPIVIPVPQDTVKSAEMNNLSIGRQYIYERLQNYDLGEAKRSSIEDLLIEYQYYSELW